MAKEMVKKATDMPAEEEVLRLLRQDAKRKEYQQSPKAKANRKTYQVKRLAEAKAARAFVKDNPEALERLIATHPELAILKPKK